MKNLTKTLTATFLICGALALAGCGNGSEQNNTHSDFSVNTAQNSVKSEPQSVLESNSESANSNTGDTTDSVTFDGFKITIDTERTMYTYIIDNQFSELNGRKVYAVPVTIENTGSETNGINMFYVTAFGASGTELDSVYAFFSDAQDFYKEMRPGAKRQTAFYMLDDGEGEYCIVFKKFTEKQELLVNIG